jgi:hypothetical protein
MEHAVESFKLESSVTVIHDPSDIRKPHSKELESIGKVRALNSKIVNGYSTHNVIALGSDNKTIKLVSNVTYSNKSPKFLKQSIINDIKSGREFDGKTEAQKLYESGSYYNKKTISKEQITNASVGLKSGNSLLKITHVLDREFDDNEYIKHIDDLNDDFVIRSKKSRSLDSADDSKPKSRLIESNFDHCSVIQFQKISIKKKTLQDGQLEIKWLKQKAYSAVKISILDRDGKNVFDESMLLLTNKKIDTLEQAYAVYRAYLKRSKIEYVFKFLKEALGWEDMQIRDFKAIENMISIAFYAAAYLYEIGEEYAQDDYTIMLADLGDGKGKVTRHFILKGMHVVMNYCKFELYRRKNKISDESVERMKSAFTIEL